MPIDDLLRMALYRSGTISKEVALSQSGEAEELKGMLDVSC